MSEEVPHDLFRKAADKIESSKPTSRRTVLRTAGHMVTGNVSAMLDDQDSIASASENLSETAIETALVFVANSILRKMSEKMGLKTGNAAEDVIWKNLQTQPITTLMQTLVVAPYAETFFFQGGLGYIFLNNADKSDLLLGEKKKMRWDVGIPVTLIFAGAHNITPNGVALDVIPLEQFIGGLLLWRLARKEGRGLQHTVDAHQKYNALWTARLLFERFPNKK